MSPNLKGQIFGHDRNSILSALMAHTSSYLLLDQKAGAVIREQAVKTIVETAKNMDRLHEVAMK